MELFMIFMTLGQGSKIMEKLSKLLNNVEGQLPFSKAHKLLMSLGAFRKLLSLLFCNKDDEIISILLLKNKNSNLKVICM